MIDTIIKRDGRKVEFDKDKITEAIQKAFTGLRQREDRRDGRGAGRSGRRAPVGG